MGGEGGQWEGALETKVYKGNEGVKGNSIEREGGGSTEYK